MSNDSNTTQRDELTREIRVADTVSARDTCSNEYEAMADAVLAKYVLTPRPTMGEAQRGNSQVILIDGIGVTDDAAWLHSKLAVEAMTMEASAHRTERIRTALTYLETEKAAQAETKLQERRDELAHEIIMDGKKKYGSPWKYANATPALQRAVDRIVELEAEAEATR